MSFIIFFQILVIASIIIFSIFCEWKNKSPIIVFHAALFFLCVIPSLLHLFNPVYDDYVYIEANLFIIIYSSLFQVFRSLSVYFLQTKKCWVSVFDEKDLGDLSGVFHTTLLVLIILSIFLFVKGLSLYSLDRIINLGWWDLVRSGSPLVIAATYFSYAGAGVLLISILIKNFSKAGFFIGGWVSIFFIFFSVFILKTRSYVLMMTMPVLVYYFYKLNGFGKIKIIVFMFVLSGVYVFSRAVRHADTLGAFVSYDIFNFVSTASSGLDYNFIDAFYYFVANNNEFEGFGENITLVRTIFFWLPSFVFDVKPIDFTYYMHAAYYGGSPLSGLSMHPTIYGDAYGNFGFFGALVYPLYLVLIISFLEKIFFSLKDKSYMLVLMSLLSVTFLIFARGAFYNGFMFTIIPAIIFFLIFSLCKLTRLVVISK